MMSAKARRHRLAHVRGRTALVPSGPSDAQLERIDALTAAGRANWLALIVYLAFVLVTTLGVEDVDFFIDSRQTELPLIGVSIPTFSFFVFAPILGAALYTYLHLHVRKLSEALAETPTGALPLEERIGPWLLNDFVLRQRPDGAIRRRPLDWLATFTTLLLVWWAGPIVLAVMWVRTWPAHALWLSGLGGAAITIAAYAGAVSWRKMRADVARPSARPQHRVPVTLIMMTALVTWMTLANAKGIWEWRVTYDPDILPGERSVAERIEAWARDTSAAAKRTPSFLDLQAVWLWDTATGLVELDAPNLSNLRLSALPPNQADLDAARERYRIEFCARRGLKPEVCGLGSERTKSMTFRQSYARQEWCARSKDDTGKTLPIERCEEIFRALEQELRHEWNLFRRNVIYSKTVLDFSDRDLRRANFRASELAGASFVKAQLDNADFSFSNLERAVLANADLMGAVFQSSRMQHADLHSVTARNADLRKARLDSADMSDANFANSELEDASLVGADLEKTDLRDTYMYGADLSKAHLFFTILTDADLSRASFRSSKMIGVDLMGANVTGADFAGVDWDRVVSRGKPDPILLARETDFRETDNLRQSDLLRMIGNQETLLPISRDILTGQLRFVPSCWHGGSAAREDRRVMERLAERFSSPIGSDPVFCPEGTVPQKTGVPWPTDESLPWERRDWQWQDRGPVVP